MNSLFVQQGGNDPPPALGRVWLNSAEIRHMMLTLTCVILSVFLIGVVLFQSKITRLEEKIELQSRQIKALKELFVNYGGMKP